jgi:hypothetical protein
MSSGRTATTAVALIVLMLLLGACGSGDSHAKAADLADRQAVMASKAAATRHRVVLARRQATLAARRRTARTTSTTSTSTPAKPTTNKPATPTRATDRSAIQRTFDSLNTAFRAGVASGISKANASNFWIGAGAYSGEECASFQETRGRGLVSEHIALHASSLLPAPGWVDPVIGKVPAGRIYQVTVDETQTLVSTGRHRSRTLLIHVTVDSDGQARLLLRCR